MPRPSRRAWRYRRTAARALVPDFLDIATALLRRLSGGSGKGEEAGTTSLAGAPSTD
ncbi:hypothetical protein GCM10017687_24000 [Streptomyces echinatus]